MPMNRQEDECVSKRVVPCQQTLDMSAEKSRLLCSGQAQTVFAGIPLTL